MFIKIQSTNLYVNHLFATLKPIERISTDNYAGRFFCLLKLCSKSEKKLEVIYIYFFQVLAKRSFDDVISMSNCWDVYVRAPGRFNLRICLHIQIQPSTFFFICINLSQVYTYTNISGFMHKPACFPGFSWEASWEIHKPTFNHVHHINKRI